MYFDIPNFIMASQLDSVVTEKGNDVMLSYAPTSPVNDSNSGSEFEKNPGPKTSLEFIEMPNPENHLIQAAFASSDIVDSSKCDIFDPTLLINASAHQDVKMEYDPSEFLDLNDVDAFEFSLENSIADASRQHDNVFQTNDNKESQLQPISNMLPYLQTTETGQSKSPDINTIADLLNFSAERKPTQNSRLAPCSSLLPDPKVSLGSSPPFISSSMPQLSSSDVTQCIPATINFDQMTPAFTTDHSQNLIMTSNLNGYSLNSTSAGTLDIELNDPSHTSHPNGHQCLVWACKACKRKTGPHDRYKACQYVKYNSKVKHLLYLAISDARKIDDICLFPGNYLDNFCIQTPSSDTARTSQIETSE